MVDEDLLLDEQIKKKKRLVLLALLTLLLATTLAALPWLQESYSPATAVADKGSPPPTSTQAVAAPVSGAIPEPEISPVGQKTAVLSVLTPESTSPNQTPTSRPSPTFTPTSEITPAAETTVLPLTATPIAATATATAASRNTPTVTQTPTEVQANEWPQMGAPPASDNSQPVAVEATRESPPYDGPEIPNPIMRPTPTKSKSVAVVPPDGLPITGINLPRKANWAVLGIIVLLLGAGVAALLRSKVRQK